MTMRVLVSPSLEETISVGYTRSADADRRFATKSWTGHGSPIATGHWTGMSATWIGWFLASLGARGDEVANGNAGISSQYRSLSPKDHMTVSRLKLMSLG